MLGGENFIGRIKAGLKGRGVNVGIVEQKRLSDHPSLEQVLHRVEKVFGKRERELPERKQFHGLRNKLFSTTNWRSP
jgi:hypothetical protein